MSHLSVEPYLLATGRLLRCTGMLLATLTCFGPIAKKMDGSLAFLVAAFRFVVPYGLRTIGINLRNLLGGDRSNRVRIFRVNGDVAELAPGPCD
jgi:hypothetical protein